MLWKDAAKYTAGHKVGHTWLAVATVLAIIASTSMIHVEAQQTGMTDQAVTEDHVRSRRALSSQQRVHLEARIAKAHAIVGRIAGDAKRRGAGPGWRQATLESLLPLSLDALEQLEQRVLTADTLPRAVMEVREDPNLLGDPNTDLVYRPINPCRFIDTRSVGGKVDGVVGYDLAANGAIYGGTAACAPKTVFGVASEDQIAAIAMNVTIVDPSAAPGFVAVKPSGASPVVSLLNWYEQGSTVQAANQGIVSTLQDNAAPDEFVVQSSAPVHVIVDLFGAFVAGPRHMFVSQTAGGPNPHPTTVQFFGATVVVVVSDPSQRILVTSFNAFGTSGAPAAALNLFICSQTAPFPSAVTPHGNGIIGLQLPASTKVTQGLTKVLQLPVGTHIVGMCGTGGAGWNNNDWGTTSAFVF